MMNRIEVIKSALFNLLRMEMCFLDWRIILHKCVIFHAIHPFLVCRKATNRKTKKLFPITSNTVKKLTVGILNTHAQKPEVNNLVLPNYRLFD